jgi:hypothetical protein
MTDCVVVGAGSDGTPRAPHSLNGVGDHVILERSQGGDTLRTQRLDSF